MTPKEKAEELVNKYYFLVDVLFEQKQCALIAVDEVFGNNTDESKHDYWIEVKQEIEKL